MANTWPKSVIARYLTEAGRIFGDPTATVDLVEQTDRIIGRCTACPERCDVRFGDPMYAGTRTQGEATRQAGTWAQEHAEKCRALPKPGVS